LLRPTLNHAFFDIRAVPYDAGNPFLAGHLDIGAGRAPVVDAVQPFAQVKGGYIDRAAIDDGGGELREAS
jgi:hypothetical protein